MSFCPYYFIDTILPIPYSPYHFFHTILSISFCSYHFLVVRFYFYFFALRYFVIMRTGEVRAWVTELSSACRDSQHLDLYSARSQVAHHSGGEMRCLHYKGRCLEIVLLGCCSTEHRQDLVFVFLWVSVCVSVSVGMSVCVCAYLCACVYLCLPDWLVSVRVFLRLRVCLSVYLTVCMPSLLVCVWSFAIQLFLQPLTITLCGSRLMVAYSEGGQSVCEHKQSPSK